MTGGSSGIGAATAVRLATDGFDVAVGYRSGADRAEQVAKEVRSAGGGALPVQLDVVSTESVERAYRTVVAELGAPTVLVNSAGGFLELHPFLEIDDALWRRTLELNIVGTVNCCRAVLDGMVAAGGGRIVNLSSVVSRTGGAGESMHYAVSKGGIDTLTLGLAREFGRHGVLVNAVAPGLVDSAIHDDFRERFERLSSNYGLLNRAGTAEEIASVIAFLASDGGSFVTGQVWHVNGGAA
ncbi:SDR family NAD(P)-dependent oxidoreductase [Blastococcus colisei]|uniref:SDR family NAD(P)-dependent oxidoreductase n=1 Tax=Blastococcus colisei TaxID=1564162 RepID=UPI0014778830|nr:SDR family oxidoreductase [Blastococcus colisei]